MFLSPNITLTPLQEEEITENCFDWLIQEERQLATKVYAIRTPLCTTQKKIGFIPDCNVFLPMITENTLPPKNL
ncbi:MAG: hypothetical protein ACI9WT_001182 [Flavobacterium sp.]|jgi:hypothetical protein